MASERELKKRLTSVSSIRKITKATKMVAAAKLRGVQSMLTVGRAFAAPMSAIWTTPEQEKAATELAEKRKADPKYLVSVQLKDNTLLVPMSSDRGLCGGVNSSLVRTVRRILDDNEGKSSTILCVGERGRSALQRARGPLFTMALVDISKQIVPTFEQAMAFASIYLQHQFDYSLFISNRFKSAISYETMLTEMPSVAKRLSGDLGKFREYEFEGDETETLTNLAEFSAASSLYHMMLENNTTEQSQKMSAMENSTKNAGELIEALKIKYNRSRQARITTELTEIISGAAALE